MRTRRRRSPSRSGSRSRYPDDLDVEAGWWLLRGLWGALRAVVRGIGNLFDGW